MIHDSYGFLLPYSRYESTLSNLLSGKWQPTVDSASNISFTDPTLSLTTPSALPGTYKLDTGEAVALVAQIFEAVAELERCGIAHRDMKVDNILVQTRPPPNVDAASEALNGRLFYLKLNL